MIQLSLPANWAREYTSRRDPVAELDQLAHDKLDAKVEIRAALEGVAEKHGIPISEVNAAVRGYAEDMLGDLTYELERELTHEIEGRLIDVFVGCVSN
jgi:hypothetical protein